MYHYSDVICFLNETNKSILFCINKKLYYSSSYSISEKDSCNQFKLLSEYISIQELTEKNEKYQHEKTTKYIPKEYDDLKKIIGDPVYFISIDHDGINYDKLYCGKIKGKDLSRLKEIDITDTVLCLADNDSKFLKTNRRYKKKHENIILTLTSPHRDMPNLTTIKNSLTSIKRFSFFKDSLSIIVADGIKENNKWDKGKHGEDYRTYKNNLYSEIRQKRYPFDNTILIESDGWNGPAKNIEKAISLVDSKTVFMNQHDLLFDEHEGCREFNYQHLREDLVEKELYLMQETLTGKDVDCIIFPRYWELVRRKCYCGSGLRYAQCCDEKPNGENGKDFELLYAKERIMSENLWWHFKDEDFSYKNMVLYPVRGYSDAQCIMNTDFIKRILKFTMSRNPHRFPEDIIHSIIRNNDIEEFNKIFLYHVFCCFHMDLKSKNKYLGQGVDEY